MPDERKAEAEERFKRINAACAKLTKDDVSDDGGYDSDGMEGMDFAYAFFSYM